MFWLFFLKLKYLKKQNPLYLSEINKIPIYIYIYNIHVY